jgi:hypothetical protein
MKAKQLALNSVAAIVAAAPILTTVAADRHHGSTGLVHEVRQATRSFHDVTVAIASGYASAGSCVSAPEMGAMGVHYPNGALVADGLLDAQRPEVLIYEQRGGRLRLLGVEFVVIAAQWDAANAGPPVLMGQHFHYVGSPNRYRLPPFYELHVWAWKDNSSGMFVDWNPAVSCEDYAGGDGTHSSGHVH